MNIFVNQTITYKSQNSYENIVYFKNEHDSPLKQLYARTSVARLFLRLEQGVLFASSGQASSNEREPGLWVEWFEILPAIRNTSRESLFEIMTSAERRFFETLSHKMFCDALRFLLFHKEIEPNTVVGLFANPIQDILPKNVTAEEMRAYINNTWPTLLPPQQISILEMKTMFVLARLMTYYSKFGFEPSQPLEPLQEKVEMKNTVHRLIHFCSFADMIS